MPNGVVAERTGSGQNSDGCRNLTAKRVCIKGSHPRQNYDRRYIRRVHLAQITIYWLYRYSIQIISLPVWDVVQELCLTDPSRPTCAQAANMNTGAVSNRSHPPREHNLDRAHHIIQELSVPTDLGHRMNCLICLICLICGRFVRRAWRNNNA